MNEDKELKDLEAAWQHKFERFTAPTPTSEQTNQLIQRIKHIDEQKPRDLRIELEESQTNQSLFDKVADMFASQWNLHGSYSWLLTGMLMIVLTVIIHLNMANDGSDSFMMWIKWMTFIIIAVISLSFRPRNEGNEIIEKLSYYPLIQQMFIRFIMIMGLQLAIVLPLSFFIIGKENIFLYLFGSFTPVLFFGSFGFVSIIWLGQKIGSVLTIIVWFSQALFDQQLKVGSLFQIPENDHFILVNMVILGCTVILLSSMMFKHRLVRTI